jgi:hypothetical protein
MLEAVGLIPNIAKSLFIDYLGLDLGWEME